MKLVTEKELDTAETWDRAKSDANFIKFHLTNMLQDSIERPLILSDETGKEVNHYLRVPVDKFNKKAKVFSAEIFNGETNKRKAYINVPLYFLIFLKNLESKDPEETFEVVRNSFRIRHENRNEYTLTATVVKPHMRNDT